MKSFAGRFIIFIFPQPFCAFFLRFILLALGASRSAPAATPVTPPVLLAPSSNECKKLIALRDDSTLGNKGYGTLTFTHPEFLERFEFTRMLSKMKQLDSANAQQVMVKRLLRSFLNTAVPGVSKPQVMRPFVIPELLCPLTGAKGAEDLFCATFKKNQAQGIRDAQTFLDSDRPLNNMAAIDKLFKPITVIVRPQRFDRPVGQEAIEFRVIYGLRSLDGTERKPASIILEFAGPTDAGFYIELATNFLSHMNRNDRADRLQWATELQTQMDCHSIGRCATTRGWQLNQLRMNELAFRGDDILWNLREFNFPSLDATASQFTQIPVSFTPWVDFAKPDRDPVAMNGAFDIFLQGKGLTQDQLSIDQSVDLFEDFMSEHSTLVTNNAALQTFATAQLSSLRNSNAMIRNKAYPYHNDGNTMAPSALARPGMKFFDGDEQWSQNLKETCQGCHVAASSIGKAEGINTLQNFYQISPRINPLGPEAGPKVAGSNVLSPFVLKQTTFRYINFLATIGCAPVPLVLSLFEEGHALRR